MLSPRWRKVLADFWGNKARSFLVIASIAVGLFAIGMISGGHHIITNDMEQGYAAINPANIIIVTQPFDEDFLTSIRRLPGIADAEGSRAVTARLKTGENEWISVELKAVPDYNKTRINLVQPERGVWPPGDRQVVFDRNRLADIRADVGDTIEIQLPSGKTRQLPLVGVVKDQTVGATGASFFVASPQGYITFDTLRWLELPDNFNQLDITVAENNNDFQHLLEIASQVSDQIARSDRLVLRSTVLRTYEHPNLAYGQAVSGVFFLLAALVVFLSGSLVTNTFSALINQQIHQIGIMKAIGANRSQIVTMYGVLTLIYGGFAFLIAMPLGNRGAYWLARTLAEQLNFTIGGYRVVPHVVMIEALIALAVPLAAGILPVLNGANITVREAISRYGLGSLPASQGPLDRLIEKIRFLSPPLLISLRNTFRRKGRMALTLLTLSLGGAIFISTFNVRISLEKYIDRISKYFMADVNITFDRPYRMEQVEQIALSIPGVAGVEGWATASCELLRPDGSVAESVFLLGPPADSTLVDPILMKGRWILPEDSNTIILNDAFRFRYPELDVGDPIRLKVNGKNRDWIISGFFQFIGNRQLIAYTGYDHLSQLINMPTRAFLYRVVAAKQGSTIEEQNKLVQELNLRFSRLGMHVREVEAGLTIHESSTVGLNIVTSFLLIMAGLTALVGSIGLTGTLSLNVLERTREIGVMRAIGATDRAIMRLVIVEGMLIGLISYVLAALLALPISRLMANTISQSLFGTPAASALTTRGFIAWLGLAMLLSAFASLLPARSATRLTVREVLAYE